MRGCGIANLKRRCNRGLLAEKGDDPTNARANNLRPVFKRISNLKALFLVPNKPSKIQEEAKYFEFSKSVEKGSPSSNFAINLTLDVFKHAIEI